MNERVGTRPSVGRLIFSCIIALVFGLLHPFVMTYQIMLPMTIPSLSTVVAVVLYASAGLVPAILFALTALIISGLGLGLPLTASSLLLWAAPAAVVIVGLRRRDGFFRQLRAGIIACMAGAVIAVVLTAMFFGVDLVETLMSQIQMMLETMMPEIWKIYQPSLSASGISMNYEEFSTMFYSVLKVMQQYYETCLPGNLLTAAAMTGVIAVLWGNWKYARRGLATAQSFVGLAEWYLPSSMTFGILLTLAAGFLLRYTPIRGTGTAWYAVSELASLAFVVQALAANDRRMKANGSSHGRRTFMTVLIALLAVIFNLPLLGIGLMSILAVLGCISALFGRKGAIRQWTEKKKTDDQ